MTPNPADLAWMRRALALARRGIGDVKHYPMVGAVVVKRGELIAEGYFHRPGQPHAEVIALNRAGDRARGATLYVSLEPCSHFGATPPCADNVIRSGVARVVAGMTDPNPLVRGKGFAKIRRAGIELITGALEAEGHELNRVFVKFITRRVPYVFLKAAMTLDGKIASRSGDARWISGIQARQRVHQLRDRVQAVIVGADTIRRDNPALTVRLAGKGRHPRPVILSSDLNLPTDAKVFKTPAVGGPIVVTTKAASKARAEKLRELGAEIIVVKKDRDGRPDLAAAMLALGKLKIASALLEGGAAVFGSALRAGVVDEVLIFVAGKLLGGDGISLTAGPGPAQIASALAVENYRCQKVGDDFLLTGRVRPAPGR